MTKKLSTNLGQKTIQHKGQTTVVPQCQLLLVRKIIRQACAVVINRCGADGNLFFSLTFGFPGTGGPLISADMRETDFLGGKAGRLSSLAGGGTTLDSSPISAPFTVGLETSILLRLGGRAGDVSPLKQNEEENSKLTVTPLNFFTVSHYQDEENCLDQTTNS